MKRGKTRRAGVDKLMNPLKQPVPNSSDSIYELASSDASIATSIGANGFAQGLSFSQASISTGEESSDGHEIEAAAKRRLLVDDMSSVVDNISSVRSKRQKNNNIVSHSAQNEINTIQQLHMQNGMHAESLTYQNNRIVSATTDFYSPILTSTAPNEYGLGENTLDAGNDWGISGSRVIPQDLHAATFLHEGTPVSISSHSSRASSSPFVPCQSVSSPPSHTTSFSRQTSYIQKGPILINPQEKDEFTSRQKNLLTGLNSLFKTHGPPIFNDSSDSPKYDSPVDYKHFNGLMTTPSPGPSSRIHMIDDENGTASDEHNNTDGSSHLITRSESPFSMFENGTFDFFASGLPPQELVGHEGFNTSGRRDSDSFVFKIPVTPWYALKLDDIGVSMFEYYSNYLANIVNVSHRNSFLDVFIPMAHEDVGVLYALVAYASFHQDMGKHEDVAVRYLNKAMEAVRADLPKRKLSTLACILIIATAEICSGDMFYWGKHLEAAAAVIEMNGGLSNFVDDKMKRWLATNFVYHEIMGASTYSRRPYFKAIEYEEILRSDSGVNSLIGCCKSIFFLMTQLSELSVKAQEIFERIDNRESGSAAELRNLMELAGELEIKIENCQPDSGDIVSLSPKDQEEQLTLFETFQLTAKLQLQQSIYRCNAANLNMQIMAADLLESLDVVLESKVQGSIVFPLFMATIMATGPIARQEMLKRFEGFYKRNQARNIMRAKDLAVQVWSLDNEGTKYVNWGALIRDQGLDVCFA